MSLPSNYSAGIARVSDIVKFVFPFEGEGQSRYIKWLADNGIKETEFLEEAQTVGTFVHKQMENYILGHEIEMEHHLYGKHIYEIEAGYNFIDRLKEKELGELVTEVYILDQYERYQGSVDLVLIDEVNKEVRIYDFKTYGIAKKRWNLPNNYKKPYDKLKKVSLQLSLYAERYRQLGYTIIELGCIILHEAGCFKEVVRIMESDEINEIINNFLTSKINLPSEITLITYKNMARIEVQTTIPNHAYSKASIILDETDFEGKTYEEKIEEAIRLQKYLINQYA